MPKKVMIVEDNELNMKLFRDLVSRSAGVVRPMRRSAPLGSSTAGVVLCRAICVAHRRTPAGTALRSCAVGDSALCNAPRNEKAETDRD